MKIFVKFDSKFDLKFEISDGKNLVKFGGDSRKTFLPARKARENLRENFRANFGANFGENFGNFVSNFATFFFGNFVQQKGGANKLVHPSVCVLHGHGFVVAWQKSYGHGQPIRANQRAFQEYPSNENHGEPGNRSILPIYHSFQNHYMFNLKPLHHVTQIAENDWEILRVILSCNCILLENHRQTVTVILINSEDPWEL